MNSNTLAIVLLVLNVDWSESPARTTISPLQATQQLSQSEPTLDRRIRRADRRRYQAVRGEQEWRNPFLLVSNLGFELRSLSGQGPRLVRLEDLRQVLAALPISDWPYGRVVALQSPGIVPADNDWIAAMNRNRLGASEILRALGADEWGWPA